MDRQDILGLPGDRQDILDILDGVFAPVQMPTTVYPLYVASRVKRGLTAALADPEKIIATIGDVQSLGNSRYAIRVVDTSGTKYRLTIEVET